MASLFQVRHIWMQLMLDFSNNIFSHTENLSNVDLPLFNHVLSMFRLSFSDI